MSVGKTSHPYQLLVFKLYQLKVWDTTQFIWLCLIVQVFFLLEIVVLFSWHNSVLPDSLTDSFTCLLFFLYTIERTLMEQIHGESSATMASCPGSQNSAFFRPSQSSRDICQRVFGWGLERHTRTLFLFLPKTGGWIPTYADAKCSFLMYVG